MQREWQRRPGAVTTERPLATPGGGLSARELLELGLEVVGAGVVSTCAAGVPEIDQAALEDGRLAGGHSRSSGRHHGFVGRPYAHALKLTRMVGRVIRRGLLQHVATMARSSIEGLPRTTTT